MGTRLINFSEYEAAIINIKKLIKNAGSIGPGVGNHNLLDGDVHPDTLDQDPLEGDFVYGGSSYGQITWQRFPQGNYGQILEMSPYGKLIPKWGRTLTISDTPPTTEGVDGDIWFEY
jgi:hypothetical protein